MASSRMLKREPQIHVDLDYQDIRLSGHLFQPNAATSTFAKASLVPLTLEIVRLKIFYLIYKNRVLWIINTKKTSVIENS